MKNLSKIIAATLVLAVLFSSTAGFATERRVHKVKPTFKIIESVQTKADKAILNSLSKTDKAAVLKGVLVRITAIDKLKKADKSIATNCTYANSQHVRSTYEEWNLAYKACNTYLSVQSEENYNKFIQQAGMTTGIHGAMLRTYNDYVADSSAESVNAILNAVREGSTFSTHIYEGIKAMTVVVDTAKSVSEGNATASDLKNAIDTANLKNMEQELKKQMLIENMVCSYYWK